MLSPSYNWNWILASRKKPVQEQSCRGHQTDVIQCPSKSIAREEDILLKTMSFLRDIRYQWIFLSTNNMITFSRYWDSIMLSKSLPSVASLGYLLIFSLDTDTVLHRLLVNYKSLKIKNREACWIMYWTTALILWKLRECPSTRTCIFRTDIEFEIHR